MLRIDPLFIHKETGINNVCEDIVEVKKEEENIEDLLEFEQETGIARFFCYIGCLQKQPPFKDF